jgi:hypothetical protein
MILVVYLCRNQIEQKVIRLSECITDYNEGYRPISSEVMRAVLVVSEK